MNDSRKTALAIIALERLIEENKLWQSMATSNTAKAHYGRVIKEYLAEKDSLKKDFNKDIKFGGF